MVQKTTKFTMKGPCDNEMRSHWPVAQKLEVYPGQDGVVTSAKVELSNTELVLPSRKLYLLECAD